MHTVQSVREAVAVKATIVQDLVSKVNSLSGTISGLLEILTNGAETPSATAEAVHGMGQDTLMKVRVVSASLSPTTHPLHLAAGACGR